MDKEKGGKLEKAFQGNKGKNADIFKRQSTLGQKLTKKESIDIDADHSPILPVDNSINNENAYPKYGVEIPIDKIKWPSPFQTRIEFDEGKIDELAGTMKSKGLINAINLRLLPDGLYELVCGERRLRAAIKNNWKTIKADIDELTDQQAAMLCFLENFDRENLTEMETYNAVVQLIREMGLSQTEVANETGLSEGRISQLLSIGKLPEDVRKRLLHIDYISEKHIRALRKLYKVNERYMYALLNDLEQYRMSGDQALERARELLGENEKKKTPVDSFFVSIINEQDKIRKKFTKLDTTSKTETHKRLDQLIMILQTLKESLIKTAD